MHGQLLPCTCVKIIHHSYRFLCSTASVVKQSQFYCGDHDLPVYRWTNSKTQFSAEELARILLIDSAVPQQKVCTKQPIHVCHNVAFVVDLHALDEPKDIRADENGVWQCNGSPVTYVSIHGQSTNTKIFRRQNMGSHSHHYKVSRTYYCHSSSPDFRRVITTVQGK